MWVDPDIPTWLCCSDTISGAHISRGHQQHVSPLLCNMIQRLYFFSRSYSVQSEAVLLARSLAVSEKDSCVLSLR